MSPHVSGQRAGQRVEREALDASSKKFDGTAWLMTVPSDDDVLAIIPHVLEADLLGEEDDFDSSVDDVQRARRIRAPREEADVFERPRFAVVGHLEEDFVHA